MTGGCSQWWNRIGLVVIAGSVIVSGGNARAGKLVDVLPSLYGGDGITLATNLLGHAGHFNSSSLDQLNTLADGLTGGLNFGSLNSTVSGFTFDMELGVPVQTQESLGPLLAERASTIGARKLNVAFAYTRIDYDRFDGDSLNDIELNFAHDETTSSLGLDSITVDLDIDLTQDVFAFFGTYGLFARLDVGVVLPFIRSDLKVDALGTINHVGTVEGDGVHEWDLLTPGADRPGSSAKDSAVGIGDVIVRAKYHFPHFDRDWIPETAFVLSVKTPSGDEDDLLGTGDTRIVPMFVANMTCDWFTPHVNVGFEFVPNHSDRQNVRLLTGFDARLHKRVTLAADFLGRWEVDDADGVGDELLDFAIGTKVNVWKSMLLLSNFIIPINRNEGIRSNLIWSLGIEYTFGAVD